MTNIETKKDTIIPTSKMINSVPVKPNPNFTSFKRLAPSIVGIAK